MLELEFLLLASQAFRIAMSTLLIKRGQIRREPGEWHGSAMSADLMSLSIQSKHAIWNSVRAYRVAATNSVLKLRSDEGKMKYDSYSYEMGFCLCRS